MVCRIRAISPLLALVTLATPAARAAGPQSILPAPAKGWKQIGQTKLYNGQGLYNLVDGEAEAILSFSFAGCAHGEYAPAKAAAPALTVDVYDMTNPLNAWGMFGGSDRQSGRPAPVGVEGVRIGATGLNFWKGRYVVRTALVGRGAATPANQKAQLAMAKSAASRIAGASGPPKSLSALPAGRAPKSERYVPKNVAGHAFLTNALSARYPALGMGAELFISQYVSPPAAKSALAAYRTYEKKNPGLASAPGLGDEAFSVRDRFAGNIVAARKGKYIVGALRARDAAAAKSLVKQALGRL
ncbi:MAG TPA: DUF6599 family protein [Armatimonadota bacterium]|jgi:hypothetical protein